jgi:hypothetical protein
VIELGSIPFIADISCRYPTYVRGETYLSARQGSAAAAALQRILDHSGIVRSCWTGALAIWAWLAPNLAVEKFAGQQRSSNADGKQPSPREY